MKKFLSFILCACLLLLGACASTPQIKNTEIMLSPYTYPEQTPATVALYYPNEDLTGVLASSEQVERKTSSFYFDVMQVLLSGTKTFSSAFPNDVSCRSTMLVQNVLYLDFSHQFEKMEAQRLFACCAVLAKTFTSFEEIDFINITVEGKQLTYPSSTRRIMLLSRYSGDILSMLATFNSLSSSPQQAQIDTFYTVLYSADASKSFLIPSVKSISVAQGEYAYSIIAQSLTLDESIFAAGFSIKSTSYKNKTAFVELIAPEGWQTPQGWLASRALAAALDLVYPDMQQISLTVFGAQGELLYSLSLQTAEVFNYIKSKIDIFVPSQSNIVYTSMLASSMPEQNDLKSFIRAYVSTVAPVLRDNDSVVNDAFLSGDLLVVDLGEAYFNHFRNLSPQNEYATVYSLIATACAYSGANRVVILQNGQTRSHFCGSISLKNPLYNLPNSYLNSLK